MHQCTLAVECMSVVLSDMGVLSGGWFLLRIGRSIIHATLCFVWEIQNRIQTEYKPNTNLGFTSVCIRFVFGLYSVCIRFVFGLYSVCISRTKQRLACIISIYYTTKSKRLTRSFNKHALSGVTWWVFDVTLIMADFTQHREELTSLCTSLYTSLLCRFIYKSLLHSIYLKYRLFSCYWS